MSQLKRKPTSKHRIKWIKSSITIGCTLIATYVIAAYLILPALWRHYEHNPKLAALPKVFIKLLALG